MCVELGEPVPDRPVPAPSTQLAPVNDAMGGSQLAFTQAVNCGRVGGIMWTADQRVGELLAKAKGFEPRPSVTAEELAARERHYRNLIEANRRRLAKLPPVDPSTPKDQKLDAHGNKLQPVRPRRIRSSLVAPTGCRWESVTRSRRSRRHCG